MLAKFVLNNLKKTSAAALYDVASEAPNGQANLFRETFEANGGKMVAFETYTTGDRDFSAQLTKIKAANPEVIFLPCYYNDVPLIVQQARRLGITADFVGSDTWSTPEIVKLGGDEINGSYFCNHYSTQIATDVAQKFMTDYRAKYGQDPRRHRGVDLRLLWHPDRGDQGGGQARPAGRARRAGEDLGLQWRDGILQV